MNRHPNQNGGKRKGAFRNRETYKLDWQAIKEQAQPKASWWVGASRDEWGQLIRAVAERQRILAAGPTSYKKPDWE